VTVLILTAVVLLLAYSNGANDNFKGVATLFGSGTTNYRRALTWATITTLAGSLLALYFAYGLAEAFKGRGIVPDATAREPAFLLAIGLGAALTVLIATFTGLPVSTTHALTGALIGAGLVATSGHVRLEELKKGFVLPLLISPVVSLMLTFLLYPLFRGTRKLLGVTSQSCICVGETYEPAVVNADGSVALVRTGVIVETGTTSQCVQRYQGRILGLEAGRSLDFLHFLSAGAVGFARGLNDTPKIVALLLAAQAVNEGFALAAVAALMALGGLLNARKVAETMSKKITGMNPGQGFTANLVTSLLVAAASIRSLPVSTTHVSVGALFGIGVVNRSARWRMILTIALAWVTTLPMGAMLGATVFVLIT